MRYTIFAILLLFLPVNGSATPISVPQFHGLRIPAGGMSRGSQPGGGGRIVVYTYSLNRAALDAQMRALLAKDGWKITSDRKSPRGTVRLAVQKAGHTIRISVTGNGPSGALILSR